MLFKNWCLRAGKTTQSVKYVPYEHEDLSSSPHPQAYVKKQVWWYDV